MIRPILAAIAVGMMGSAFAQTLPKGYIVPDNTLSPDKKYGVTVFDNEKNEMPDEVKSQVVEVKTGRALGTIEGVGALTNMNHDEVIPTRWTADDSALLWLIDGKWGYSVEILIHLKDGKITSQVDVMAPLQKEILKRTKAVVPKEYAQVKKDGEGDGSWFKDGFAIDCVPDGKNDGTDGPLKFPLLYHVFLTSNTKGLEDVINVDSHMTALLNEDGTITVKEFHMGKEPHARNW